MTSLPKIEQSSSEPTWKERRLGGSYLMGVQRRQVRVGRAKEPIVVLRVCEDLKVGDEIVMTGRDLRFVTAGMHYEGWA